MAIELEGLEFQIEVQSDSAHKGIENLTNTLTRLKNATKGGLGLNSSVKQLQKLNETLESFHTEKLEGLGKALEGLNGLGSVKISPTIAKRISDITTAADSITPETISNIENLTQALSGLGAVGNINMPNLRGLGNVTGANGQVNPTTATPADSGVEQVQETIQSTNQATGAIARMKSMLSGLGGAFSKAFSTGVGKLKSLASGAAKVSKGFIKMSAAIPKLALSRFIGKVKQTTSSLGHLFGSLKRIAMYRAVRAAISALTQGFKDGISNLYQYSLLMDGQFAKSMDRLATSGQYLKNSLGAMAAPIINALAPAIDFVIDKIVTLLNLINQLIARLSGAATFTAAKKVGKAWADAAGSAGGAAKKAADEIKRYTLGFDELNILGKNKDDSGSGGGGGGAGDTDYASMFEELPIDNAIGDFATRLREAFDNQDWETLGRLLGGKVNEIFDSINWAGIGTKLGKGIDGAVKTLYYFLDEVDFTNIGSHLAELLNNTLANIDFSFVGALLIKPFTSLADLIIGFVTELDWGLVTKSISDCIKGIFDECSRWLDSVDWAEFGQTLWQKIKDAVANIDFAGIASSLFTYLGKAIRAAALFLGNFFGSIAEDIKTWWNNDIRGADWKETAHNLLSAIGNAIKGAGQFLHDNVVDPLITAITDDPEWESKFTAWCTQAWEDVKEFFSSLPGKAWEAIKKAPSQIGYAMGWMAGQITKLGIWWETTGKPAVVNWFKSLPGAIADWWENDVVPWFQELPGKIQTFFEELPDKLYEIGTNVINGFIDGCVSIWNTITTAVSEWIDGFVQGFKDALGIHSPSTVMAEIGENTILGFLNAIAAPFKNIWEWVKTNVIDPLVQAFSEGGAIAEFVVGVKNTAKDWWKNITKWFSKAASKGVEFLANIADTAEQWWSDVQTWWGNTVGKVKEFTTGVRNQASTWWNNVKNWWSGKVGAVAQFTTSVANQAASWWSDVNTWWNQKVGKVKEFWTWVTNQAGSWWSDVQTWWSGKVGKVKEFTTYVTNKAATWWSSVNTWWNGVVGKVKEFTTNVTNQAATWWSNVKTWWSGKVGAVANFTTNVTNQAATWWSNVKTWWSGKVGSLSVGVAVTNAASTWWSNVRTWWNNAAGNLYTTLHISIPKISVKWGSITALGKTFSYPTGFTLSYNAKGGILDGAQIFGMLGNSLQVGGEAGQEALLPLERHTEWMDTLAQKVRAGLPGEGSNEEFVDGMRQAVMDANARQNDLLREQNELLRQLLAKDTTVEVTANSFTKAINRKNQRDGKTVIPVST